MKRTFNNDFEKAEFHLRRVYFWIRVSIFFAVVALIATIVGAVLRAT